MYLSDRDLEWAIKTGQLVLDRPDGLPPKVDPTSIDLHLDHVDQAQVWDLSAILKDNADRGEAEPILAIGRFHYPNYAKKYLMPPQGRSSDAKVYRDGGRIYVRPQGLLL